MDYTSVMLLISLIAKGVGVVKEVADLAKRVEAGEVISKEDIEAKRKEIDQAVDDWNSVGPTKFPLDSSDAQKK